MTDAPERIWACYDPSFDATYWKKSGEVYPADAFVGEYVNAEREWKLVKALRWLIPYAAKTEAGAEKAAIASATLKELGL